MEKTPPGILGQGPEGEPKNKGAEEYYARQFSREGQAAVEVLGESVEKKQLVHTAREYMAMFEDMSLHPDGSISEYRIGDTISMVADRRAAMDHTVQDLIDLDFIPADYVQKEGGVANFTFPGYAYTKHEEPVLTGTRKIRGPRGEDGGAEEMWGQGTVFLPGTDIQRDTLHTTLTEVEAEMVAREDIVKQLRWVWNQTENLEGLVKFYFMGSLTNESMRTLCDAEGRINGLTRTEGGAELRKGHEFGDAVSASLQCLEIAALSEKPAELEALLKRPGIRFLFNVKDQEVDDIFLSPDKRNDRPLNAALVKWIGEPWSWKKDVRKGKEDMEGEKRGLLTEKGNILCKSEWSDAEYVFEQIERFLGGGPDAKRTFARKDARDARFVAWGLLKVTGMSSDLGGQTYHYEKDDFLNRPEGDYTYHEMGTMTSCDRIKVIGPNIFTGVYRFLKSEIRGYGPHGAFGKYPPRFTVPYFKNWNVKTEDEEIVKGINVDGTITEKNIGGKGDFGKRTFDEMRWGYRAGKERDLAESKKAGKDVEIDYPEESAYRLGELPWGKLTPKAYNAAALGPYIAGREEIGIFQYMMKTNWRIDDLKENTFWEKFAANMGISLNAQTVFNGRFRGIYNGNSEHDGGVGPKVADEVRNYKRKLLLAFWDGIRSLPQYKDWCALRMDETKNGIKSGLPALKEPIKRILFRLGRVGIIEPEEAMKLPTDALETDQFA